jgi:hypothetical protein
MDKITMITEYLKNILTWTNIKRTITLALWLIGITAVFQIGMMMHETNKIESEARKENVCPSILSIARSARDTLIVMKAEPLCNEFVLENLE